jgi:hypothetical protein
MIHVLFYFLYKRNIMQYQRDVSRFLRLDKQESLFI